MLLKETISQLVIMVVTHFRKKHVEDTLNITIKVINMFLIICKVLNNMKEEKKEELVGSFGILSTTDLVTAKQI
jgi:hypothetical protein